MKRSFRYLLVLFFICTVSEVNSQDLSDVPINIEPLWSTPSNISAGRLGGYELTAMGTLVVTSDTPTNEASASGSNSAASKISGYNPDTGALIFQNGKDQILPKNIDQSSFSEIPNTPYFAIADRDKNTNQYVVSLLDGQVVANTEADGLDEIYHRFVLPKSETVLFVGRIGMRDVLALYDLKTGKSLWVQKKLFRSALVDERIASEPLEVSETAFLIASEGGLYCVDIRTGEKKWRAMVFPDPNMGFDDTMGFPSKKKKKEAEKEAEQVSPIRLIRYADKPYVYMLDHGGIMAHDIETGDKQWKRYRTGSYKAEVVFGPDGLIVMDKKLFMYDYDTGEKLWDKPQRLDGQVIASRYRLNLRQADVFEFNVLDITTGKLRFKDNYKVEGHLLEVLACDAGIFYTTDSSINIWNTTTGKNAFDDLTVTTKDGFLNVLNDWSYVPQPNGMLLTAFRGKMAYVYNNENYYLFEIDTEKATKRLLVPYPVSFKSGTKPDHIEARDSGVFISSSQNAALIGYDGSTVYETSLPSVSYSKSAKFFAFFAKAIETVNEQNGRTKGPNTSYSDVINKKGVRASVNVGLANTILNNRFEASKQGKDFYYIFAKLGKENDKGGGVVKLNKDTGKAIMAVPFGFDKSPDFIVDEDSGKLFYFKMKKEDDFNGGGNSMMGRAIEILCYQL